ncbi:hypothetical protein JL720_802 [Aureococcus anophagefferens]|nr:hypothetical protein JL720_802 [Aureococcus anophagefferens]
MAKKRRLNTFDGMRLWFEGVGYLGTRPLLLLRHILPFTALTVCACVGTSLTLWVCALPLRLVGYKPSLDGLLRSTAVSALQTTQWLRPATSGGAFFAALDGRAPALAAELRAAPTAKQFLYQYDARQDAAAWAQFTAEHRWALFGFGLPSWAATQYVHPLAGLLLLEANQGAAATFLAEAFAGSVD